METVEHIHIATGLAALVLCIPLFSSAFLLFYGKRLPNQLAGWIGTAASSLSFLCVLTIFFQIRGDKVGISRLYEWIHSGTFTVDATLRFDALSITMALFVSGIGSLIHLYSVGYMKGDPRFSRFFCYLNLFLASMLLLVLGDNFLLTFVGWEGVGTCSYLLISFWFERNSAATAGKKAFVVNRIGDFGFLLGMFVMFYYAHSLNFDVVLSYPFAKVTATALALLLFLGAVGKSAQLPLYVWLPDAMEGPTPVSALIHAATMVTAGVYLMVRIHPILDLAPTAQTIIAVVGCLTALFAATIAVAQNDIKKVLAYSTVSQLGYMFLAVGSGAYVAAIFHMITHAFFKALLFLGAGSVIHGMHHEQDMKKMGALRKFMPITFATFIVGWLAISGVPPFSGFWSKDEILHAAFDKSPILWALGWITALLTAYYMTRQVMLVFYGKARWKESEHHVADPHESPWTMTVPLIVLGSLAVLGGLANLPFGPKFALEHWLGLEEAGLAGSTVVLAGLATLAAGIGILVGWLLWRKSSESRGLEPRVLAKAWFVDPFYAAIIQRPGQRLANFFAFFVDKKVIDGAVDGSGTVSQATGSLLQKLQSGYVRTYALILAAGFLAVLVFQVFRNYA